MQFKANVHEYSGKLLETISNKMNQERMNDKNPRERLNIGTPSSMKKKVNQHVLSLTCVGYLKRGKIPPSSVTNSLELQETDKEIIDQDLNLTELENSLIAHRIIFQKIFLLPKSRWTATVDKQVNIPITNEKINETIELLPRTPNQAGLIGVELKRRLEYKGNHKHQTPNDQSSKNDKIY